MAVPISENAAWSRQLALQCNLGGTAYFLPLLWFVTSIKDARAIFKRLEDLLLPSSVGKLQIGRDRIALQFNLDGANLKEVHYRTRGFPVALVLHSFSHSRRVDIPLPQYVLRTTDDLDSLMNVLETCFNARHIAVGNKQSPFGSYSCEIHVLLDYKPSNLEEFLEGGMP